MYRIAIESVLGLTLHAGHEIRLKPCIPRAWPGFALRYRRPDGTAYDIEVTRTDGALEATLDGEPLNVTAGVSIPLATDGRVHTVHVRWPR